MRMRNYTRRPLTVASKVVVVVIRRENACAQILMLKAHALCVIALGSVDANMAAIFAAAHGGRRGTGQTDPVYRFIRACSRTTIVFSEYAGVCVLKYSKNPLLAKEIRSCVHAQQPYTIVYMLCMHIVYAVF